MALFTETIRAQQTGARLECALFVTFDFKTAPMNVWEGDGPPTRDGVDWRGMGHRQDGNGNPLQSIEGLEQAINGTAPQLNLTLSGVDRTVVAAAKKDADADEIEGRDLIIRLGFFDVTKLPALIPLDSLVVLGVWVMQKPSFQSNGPRLRTIKLPCETIWAQRSRAPGSLLTDRDQQRLFPGDKGLQFVPTLVDKGSAVAAELTAPMLADLADHCRTGASMPFRDGEHDCVFWAGDWVRSRVGFDPLAAWRGRVGSKLACARAERRAGGLVIAVDDAAAVVGLARIDPSDAAPGDIGVVLVLAGRRQLVRQALAVRGRTAWLAKIGPGLARAPQAVAAWRIG